ncbi:MAG TPA: GreA/GreB family elongation factor [Caldilineaceae bacterium]|nr:GreA/GreB family elongation factor [Caldilineaceae bacterium]
MTVSGDARVQVGLGCHVEVELIDEQGHAERLEFDLVTEQAADFSRGLLGANTPLGRAIRGKAAGSEVAYVMGDVRRVRILAVGPARLPQAGDAAERRQAVLEEARRKAERTNAEMFAASYDGKWGDYTTDEMVDLPTE